MNMQKTIIYCIKKIGLFEDLGRGPSISDYKKRFSLALVSLLLLNGTKLRTPRHLPMLKNHFSRM